VVPLVWGPVTQSTSCWLDGPDGWQSAEEAKRTTKAFLCHLISQLDPACCVLYHLFPACWSLSESVRHPRSLEWNLPLSAPCAASGTVACAAALSVLSCNCSPPLAPCGSMMLIAEPNWHICQHSAAGIRSLVHFSTPFTAPLAVGIGADALHGA
jgi:hypothetical protein